MPTSLRFMCLFLSRPAGGLLIRLRLNAGKKTAKHRLQGEKTLGKGRVRSDLHTALAGMGMEIRPHGNGLIIKDRHGRAALKASAVAEMYASQKWGEAGQAGGQPDRVRAAEKETGRSWQMNGRQKETAKPVLGHKK